MGKNSLIFLLLLTPLSIAYSQDAKDLSHSPLLLEDVIGVALSAGQDHPEIVQTLELKNAAKARIPAAFAPERPELEIERMYAPTDQNFLTDAAEKNIAVKQEIPSPARFILQTKIAKRESAISEALYQAKQIEMLARVKMAYAAFYLSDRSLRLFTENAALLEEWSRVAEARYAAGKATQGETLKIQMELGNMIHMKITSEGEREVAKASLNLLLNRPPEAPLGNPGEIPLQPMKRTFEDLFALAKTKSPRLTGASAEVKKSRETLSLSRWNALPDLSVQYRYREMSALDSEDAIFGLSVPLFAWKEKSEATAAKAEHRAALAGEEAVKRELALQIKTLLVKVETSGHLASLYRDHLIPQARQALNIEKAHYEANHTAFVDLFETSETLLNARLEYHRNLSAYRESLAALEEIVGDRLEENGDE